MTATAGEQATALAAELPELPAANLLVEPVGRNTAPCIGLAAAVLQARGADADTMVVLPADHAIARVDEFRAVLADIERDQRRPVSVLSSLAFVSMPTQAIML